MITGVESYNVPMIYEVMRSGRPPSGKPCSTPKEDMMLCRRISCWLEPSRSFPRLGKNTG